MLRDCVFYRLDRPGAHGLAGGLRGELLLFLRERVDALARGSSGLFDDHEFREAVQHEEAVLLQLLVAERDERLDDLLHLLARDAIAHGIRHGVEDVALREGLFAAMFDLLRAGDKSARETGASTEEATIESHAD
jgi:hypothetical protein